MQVIGFVTLTPLKDVDDANNVDHLSLYSQFFTISKTKLLNYINLGLARNYYDIQMISLSALAPFLVSAIKLQESMTSQKKKMLPSTFDVYFEMA